MQLHRNTLRRASTAALALALLGGATVAAQAEDFEFRGRTPRSTGAHGVANGNLVDVQVQVEGQSSPFYFRPGYGDRHYFQAFKGRNYSLVVRNNTGRRVGVLIAVDGINVVNGEKSRLSRNESMYVLDPYERAVVRGWRTSLHDIRKFVFVDEERSYAERTGQSNGDLGWIRVLSFRENAPVVRYRSDDDYDYNGRRGNLGEESRETAPPMAARPESKDSRGETRSHSYRGEAPDANPGTGWGQQGYDPVQRTEFRAARQATDQILLRYEYAAGLRALGIIPGRNRLWDREEGNLGFAQPPRW